MELALSLVKLINEKFVNLHGVAVRNHDAHFSRFVEREILTEHSDTIKEMSEYVAQLRRVGQGEGLFHFNEMMREKY